MYAYLDSNDRNKDNSKRESSPQKFPCRFCEKKFSKSQALGGHMNGHRQERENEKYSKAKALLEQKYRSSSSNMNIQSNKYVAAQSYSAIPGGVQTHAELFSPSQLQNRVQIGCSSSYPTFSNQNVGGGILRVESSLPSSHVNHTQQQQQQGFDQNQAGQYRSPLSIPANPNCHIMGAYPYLPYQSSMNNNLQTGGGASLPYQSSMNNNLEIMEPSFPTLQGREPNFVVNEQAAPLPSEQQRQFVNAVFSPLSPWS